MTAELSGRDAVAVEFCRAVCVGPLAAYSYRVERVDTAKGDTAKGDGIVTALLGEQVPPRTSGPRLAPAVAARCSVGDVASGMQSPGSLSFLNVDFMVDDSHAYSVFAYTPRAEDDDDDDVRRDLIDWLQKQQLPETEPRPAEPLTLYIDHGTAPPEEIAELLAEISTLYRMMGGSGINFTVTDVRCPEPEMVP